MHVRIQIPDMNTPLVVALQQVRVPISMLDGRDMKSVVSAPFKWSTGGTIGGNEITMLDD